MYKFLYLIFLLFSSSVVAQTVTITCTPPAERTDRTPITAAEIQGYNLYYSDGTSGVYPNKVSGFATCEATVPQSDFVRHAVMTTVDVDGRESAYSNEVIIPAASALAAPNAISNFAVSYLGGNDYQISWTLPTTDVNGNPLPSAEISKLFLFEVSADGSTTTWLQDLQGNQTTHNLVLTPGVTHYAIEVERTSGAQRSISAKSRIATVIVLAFPKPPVIQ